MSLMESDIGYILGLSRFSKSFVIDNWPGHWYINDQGLNQLEGPKGTHPILLGRLLRGDEHIEDTVYYGSRIPALISLLTSYSRGHERSLVFTLKGRTDTWELNDKGLFCLESSTGIPNDHMLEAILREEETLDKIIRKGDDYGVSGTIR